MIEVGVQGPKAKPDRFSRGDQRKVGNKGRGLTRSGRFRSKAQHRWAFATRQPWARGAAVRGRYQTLPPRVAKPTLRTAR